MTKKLKINKFHPIFRIPKSWIDPEGEKRIKIPLEVVFTENQITISKINK